MATASAKKTLSPFSRPIGIYVDSQGEGHRRRAIAIAKQAPGYFTLLGAGLKGKTEAMPLVDLPADSPAAAGAAKYGARQIFAGGAQQHRLSRIAAWIDTAQPALMLIDSCVEAAALARAKGVPTVYMRLSGKRYDYAHIQAFAEAEAVLCPFHPLLESDFTPQWLRARSHYFPGLTQIEEEFPPRRPAALSGADGKSGTMLIIAGHDCRGKRHLTAKTAQFAAAARALPDWQIHIIGQNQPADAAELCPANLHFHGWVENMNACIAKADIVVGAASDCLISAVAAAGKPFICVPQQRPFGEQYEKAERLAALHAAVICRRWPRHWPAIVRKALKYGAVLSALHDESAAANAAEFLLDLAYGAKQPALKQTALQAEIAAEFPAVRANSDNTADRGDLAFAE